MASRLPTPYSSSRELRGFDPLTELHREMNRLFDSMFSGGPGGALSSGSGAGPGFMQPRRGYHVMERGWGRFQRSVQLPFAPDPEQVHADCEHGVLTIRLPKQAQLERSRRIPIGGGAGRQAVGAGPQQATEAPPRTPGQEQSGAAGETAGEPNVHH